MFLLEIVGGVLMVVTAALLLWLVILLDRAEDL